MKNVYFFIVATAVATGVPIFVTGELIVFNALANVWGYGCLPVGPCESTNHLGQLMVICEGVMMSALGGLIAVGPLVTVHDALEVSPVQKPAS